MRGLVLSAAMANDASAINAAVLEQARLEAAIAVLDEHTRGKVAA